MGSWLVSLTLCLPVPCALELPFQSKDLTVLHLYLHTIHGPPLPPGQNVPPSATLSRAFHDLAPEPSPGTLYCSGAPHSSHLERTGFGNNWHTLSFLPVKCECHHLQSLPSAPQRTWDSSELPWAFCRGSLLSMHILSGLLWPRQAHRW